MTASLLADALARLHAADQLLRVISASEDPKAPDVGTRAAKGLFFVQLYAIYEYTLVEGVRAVLREFNSRAVPTNQVRPALLPIALDSSFAAIRTASVDRTWEVRAALVSKSISNDSAQVSESLFPKDGSFFRMSQLRLIWNILEPPSPLLPAPRLQSHIEELVGNRNDIAHGSIAPEEVGGRYTVAELESRLRDTELLCSHLLQAFAALIAGPGSFR